MRVGLIEGYLVAEVEIFTFNVAERRRDASFGRQLHLPGDPVPAVLPVDDAAAAPRDGRNCSQLEHDPKSLNQKVIFTHWVL